MRGGVLARRFPAAIVVVGLGMAAILVAERAGLIEPAQAQGEADRRKKGQESHKSPPPKPHRPSQPSFKPAPTPKLTAPPPSKGAPYQKPLPPSERPALRKQLSPPDKQYGKPAPSFEKRKTAPPPPFVKPLAKPAPDFKPDRRKEGVKPPLPPSGTKGPPVKVAPLLPPSGSPGLGTAFKRFDDVKKSRLERVEDGGKRRIIEEPGKRFIVKEGGRTIVRHDETERFLKRPGAKLDRRPDGSTETVYAGRDGVRIVTVVDAHGRLLRRYRIDRDGRERNLIDNRRFYRGLAVGVGIGALAIMALDLPPPRVTIPAEQYIVPYDAASDDDLYDALEAPPIEDLDRAYSLDEIRDNYGLRARLRSIDIDTIHFDSGAWEVSPDQYGKLERIARAMLRVLERNPEAVFLIAGYTDAVGSEDDNASLSDRRAEAVAGVLTDEFDVPAENLVTQGYGEQFLKIDTEAPEPRNRRVGIYNITRLMAER